MRKTNLKRLAAGILIAASLLVSSVSACVCHRDPVPASSGEHCQPKETHHRTETETSRSPGEATGDARPNAPETKNAALSFPARECCCISPAPKVFAKSESVKSEKQAARVLPAAQVEIILVARVASFKRCEFAPSFYLPDSFYNLAPGRAPPRS